MPDVVCARGLSSNGASDTIDIKGTRPPLAITLLSVISGVVDDILSCVGDGSGDEA